MIYGIREQCMYKWNPVYSGNDPNANFSFNPTQDDYLLDRWLGGTIWLDDHNPSECISQQQLSTGCLNRWVHMHPKKGGDFWFWPTTIGANPKLVTGWLYVSDNLNMDISCSPPLPNIEGNWDTTWGRLVLTKNAVDPRKYTGPYSATGRIEGSLVYKSGWQLIGKWFEPGRTGGFEFYFDSFLRSFKGTYGSGESSTGGKWDGQRVS
ncbi:hypothetical protein ACIQYG_26085 [Peribacillus sp. NPDC096622]|uniref:hypothetical protein n=1 Tax=Peribacillus sp. NPDC096622 TaxID=3364396 RepID=UPI0037F4B5ED